MQHTNGIMGGSPCSEKNPEIIAEDQRGWNHQSSLVQLNEI